MENRITLIGDVVSAPRESHKSNGKKFYKFFIGVERKSGVADILPVLFDKEISDTGISGRVYVSGKIITRHVKTGSGKAILTYVMADTIKPKDDAPLNEVSLDGIIEENRLRETPLGRKICDVKLKTVRENGKEDLITCIAWGKCAEYTDSLALGDRVSTYGRLQSRRYKKTCKDGHVVEKVTYELSIKGIVGV
nr:MAG TPA: Single strand binding protein [Caudoviricetes sp.]